MAAAHPTHHECARRAWSAADPSDKHLALPRFVMWWASDVSALDSAELQVTHHYCTEKVSGYLRMRKTITLAWISKFVVYAAHSGSVPRDLLRGVSA